MQDPIIKQKVYDKGLYAVHVIKLDDSPGDCYGVVNKEFGIVENVQNILPNARDMCDKMNEWLEGQLTGRPATTVPGNPFSDLPPH